MRAEWILSRALCRYRILDFPDVPRAKRAAALRLQLSQFAPFPDPGYTVAWEGASAQVWCWDAAKLREAVHDAGVAEARVRVVPEPLFFPPLVDGPRLMKIADGYEGQVWKNSTLAQSRFWSALPDTAQWIAFQRDAGILPESQQATATPTERELLPQPYTKVGEGLSHASPLMMLEPLLLFLFVAALGVASAWYASRYLKVASRSQELTAQMKALEISAAPVLSARQKALDNDIFTSRLARVALYPGQLSLIAELAGTLAKDGVVLREWNFNLGKLRVVLAYPNAVPAASTVVAAFEAQPDFTQVRTMPGNEPKSLIVSAEVRPRFRAEHE